MVTAEIVRQMDFLVNDSRRIARKVSAARNCICYVLNVTLFRFLATDVLHSSAK